MKQEEEQGDSTCNIETDRIDAQQMQFHRLVIDTLVFSQTAQIAGPASKTTKATTKRFAFPQGFLQRGNKEPKISTEVSFAGSILTKLPPNFLSRYVHAKSLDLRENLLSSFPIEIPRLFSLRILRLDDNKISVIPSEIASLSQLQILTLSKNLLQNIEPAISKLKLLTALVLNDNYIFEWPAWIYSLSKLRLFHIHNNPNLSNIPLTFSKMESLNELGFDWFLYLNPPIGKVLKGLQGFHYISELKDLCRNLEKNCKGRLKACGFFDFLIHFIGISEDNLLPPLYPKSRTPLHLAAMYGHYSIVNEYLATPVDCNMQDAEGSTAFSLALRNNKHKVARLLLLNEKINITLTGKKHGSPLHIAVLRDQFEAAKKIIARPELDPNARDLNGNTALHYLFVKFESNPVAIAKITGLLTNREDCDLNPNNNSGQTPLLCAARSKQDTAIKFAINFNRGTKGDRKFDFSAVSEREKLTILHYIAQYCEIETLEIVLRKCDEERELFKRDKMGRTVRDCVKNSTAGKLLYRYEKKAVKDFLLERENNSPLNHSGVETARNLLEANKNEEIAHSLVNRAEMQPSIEKEPRGSDFAEAIEIDSPIDLMAYSTNPPAMFEELRKMNEFFKTMQTSQEKNDEPRIELVDDSAIQAEVLHNNPQKVYSPSFNLPGKDLVIECPTASLKLDHCMSPTVQVPTPKIAGGFLTMAYKKGSLKAQLMNTTKILPTSISRNPFAHLYHALLQGDAPNYEQYRMVYHIFSKYLYHSQEILVLLCEQLDKTSPIINDIVYLLGLIKSRKATKSFETILTQKPSLLLLNELCNARTNIKRGQNCLPVKYCSQTPNQEQRGDRFLRTQVMTGVKNLCNLDLASTFKFKGNRRIQCLPTNRRIIYFGINS